MELANNVYSNAKTNGIWNAPTQEQQQIIALTAQLTKYEKLNKDFQKKVKLGNKKDNDKKVQEKGEEKGVVKDKRRKEIKYPEWKQKRPKPGEPQVMTKNGRQYYWCKWHNLWTAHKPEKCKLAKDKDKDPQDQSNPHQANNANPWKIKPLTPPSLQLNSNLHRISGEDEEDF